MDSLVIESRVYIDQECYPIATTLALDALKIMQEVRSSIYLPTLRNIHEMLKASPEGNSSEVAELGIRLLFLEYPDVFSPHNKRSLSCSLSTTTKRCTKEVSARDLGLYSGRQ